MGIATRNKKIKEFTMGDNVSFKVFYKKEGEDEVRRFVIDKNVSTSFDYLVGKLEMVFPGLKGAQYSVCWSDADGDNVTITSDEELIPAGGQEWRHWQGSGHSPACQEVKKTFQ